MLTADQLKDVELAFEVPRFPDVQTLARTVMRLKDAMDCPRTGAGLLRVGSTVTATDSMPASQWWRNVLRTWALKESRSCATCVRVGRELAKLVVRAKAYANKVQQKEYRRKELKRRETLLMELQNHRDQTVCGDKLSEKQIPFYVEAFGGIRGPRSVPEGAASRRKRVN